MVGIGNPESDHVYKKRAGKAVNLKRLYRNVVCIE